MRLKCYRNITLRLTKHLRLPANCRLIINVVKNSGIMQYLPSIFFDKRDFLMGCFTQRFFFTIVIFLTCYRHSVLIIIADDTYNAGAAYTVDVLGIIFVFIPHLR